MTLKEARLVLPEGIDDASIHHELKRTLSRRFGGYTATAGNGGWIDDDDDDSLVQEPVIVYDVAMPDTGLYRDRLREVAVLYAAKLKQKAVYIRYANGNVDIVTLPKPAGLPAEEGGDGRPGPAYPGAGISQTATATANAERKLGVRRLPRAGEIWKTASDGRAAVLRPSSHRDGGWRCVLLDPGKTALAPTYQYSVDLDGRHNRGGDINPLDLFSHVSNYL